ncbi:hypothetical protein H0H92_006004 [Tricholoma furcatifolium]|nr:hypothetical protein H0H92_006004 [Tricholoma furcatifolium]
MAEDNHVKSEERESPSFEPTGNANGSPNFPLPPPSPGNLDQLKKEEPMQEPLSSLSSAREPTLDPKIEDERSPSQSPTLKDTSPPQKFKLSPSPTPPPSTADGTDSMSSTPPPSATPVTTGKKAQASAVLLIGDLPIAREPALATFNEIVANNYQYKTLGRSREALESMTFQKRDYAHIEIVQTELKGFGLRAESFLARDTFIYEYVGDVVNPPSFKKRMREYAEEGIEHFYFMMLQKDEFIDATKSGGIGRFANHSCRPNCYVAKWTIGNHVRMGIFAKRDIKKHEELTFNYNVDRYGHQAQTCYCGESNCVGYIGGKTQTDVATMDDLYLDALGITDETDLMELKGSKKKKGKKIDDPDFMPTMKPLQEKEIPKLVQAMRQTQSRKVLVKLLTRIKLTEDQAALRQIMRLRGYSVMTNILDDNTTDVELVNLALSCMSTWPLLNRNKVDDSRVIHSVRSISEKEDDRNRELAQTLVSHWESLPVYTRIPKRVITELDDNDIDKHVVKPANDQPEFSEYLFFPAEKPLIADIPRFPRPKPTRSKRWTPQPVIVEDRRVESQVRREEFSRESVRAVIAAAAEAEAAAAKAAAEAEAEAKAKVEAKAAARAAKIAKHEAAKAAKREAGTGENGHHHKKQKKAHTVEEKEALKEKRMLKLVGAVVVKCMSRHSKAMGHDQFKKYAKELTQIITDKEKKSSSYREGRLESLSEEKVTKIKKFAKEYIAKVLKKLEKSSKRTQGSSSTAPTDSSSAQQDTLNDDDDDAIDEVVMGDASVDNLNINFDSDVELDSDGNEGDEDQDDPASAIVDGDGGKRIGYRSPMEDSPPTAQPWGDMNVDDDDGHSPHNQLPSDPRRRPPKDDESGEVSQIQGSSGM